MSLIRFIANYNNRGNQSKNVDTNIVREKLKNCIQIILVFIFTSTVPSTAFAQYYNFVEDGGGISGVITGLLTLLSLYLMGYPFLFIINAIGLIKKRGYKIAKNKIIKVTNQSIELFVSIGIIVFLFAIPLSVIPFGIIYVIVSVILDLSFGIQYGKYVENIFIYYFYISLIVGFLYTLKKTVKETKL